MKYLKNLIARIKMHSGHVLFQAFVPLVAPNQSSKLGNLYGSSNLSDFVNGLFKFALAVGAIGAVLRIAYAGYLYMGAADMWSTKSEAKKVLGDVTFGILLLLAIYLILYQINPDILKLTALKNIKPVPKSQSSGASPSSGSDTGASPSPFGGGAFDGGVPTAP